jgi:hypothetical protein
MNSFVHTERLALLVGTICARKEAAIALEDFRNSSLRLTVSTILKSVAPLVGRTLALKIFAVRRFGSMTSEA